MTKKIFTLLMTLVMLLGVFNVSFNAFAGEPEAPADDEIIERYTVIDVCSYSVKISGITATCKSSLTAKYSTSLYIKMELQKYSSGSYSTVKTWTTSKTGTTTSLSGTKAVNPLSTYRLKVTFTAGGETITRYASP